MQEIKVYTIPEVMDILKCTKKTIYKFIQDGKIKAVKVGREWRITEQALADFLGIDSE